MSAQCGEEGFGFKVSGLGFRAPNLLGSASEPMNTKLETLNPKP